MQSMNTHIHMDVASPSINAKKNRCRTRTGIPITPGVFPFAPCSGPNSGKCRCRHGYRRSLFGDGVRGHVGTFIR